MGRRRAGHVKGVDASRRGACPRVATLRAGTAGGRARVADRVKDQAADPGADRRRILAARVVTKAPIPPVRRASAAPAADPLARVTLIENRLV